jgi:hypothetical protein
MFYVFSDAKIKQNNDKSAQNRQKNQKSIKKNDFIVTNCYSKRGKGRAKKKKRKREGIAAVVVGRHSWRHALVVSWPSWRHALVVSWPSWRHALIVSWPSGSNPFSRFYFNFLFLRGSSFSFLSARADTSRRSGLRQ